jgi:WD40 repeat protein
VRSGKSIKYIRFPNKLKQIEFDLGSNRFLLLHDEYKPQTPSKIKVFDFKTIFNFTIANEESVLKIPTVADFDTVLNDANSAKPNKTVSRALWYVDNQTFFTSTTDGWVIHYDMKGKVLKKALLHEGTPINSLAFSKNFAILATAANNGSKIVDP